MTDLVNIFDEDAFAEVLNSNESAASRADSIAHATKRTIDERWAEDPTYYKRFSELIRQAIENFWAKRSVEHTSEVQSLLRNSYAVFYLKKKQIDEISTS